MTNRFSSLKLVALAGALGVGVVATPLAATAIAAESLLPAPTPTLAQAPGDIVDVASSNPNFSTLVAAVEAAGLVDALQSEGPLTVFAPTNEAFAALPAGFVETLLMPANQDLLTQVLTYHVVPGAVMSTDLTSGPVETLSGDQLTVDTTDGVTVDGVDVIAADVPASNGVIHVIDEVLVPVGLVAAVVDRMAVAAEPAAPAAEPTPAVGQQSPARPTMAPATATPQPRPAQPTATPTSEPVRGLW